MAKPKLTREDCDDIRRQYADRTRKETSGTLARLFRVTPATILRVIDNRYTPLEDYEARMTNRTGVKQMATKLRNKVVQIPGPAPVAKPIQTINITPEGCKTPEGNARVNKAMKAFEDSTAEVANAATEFLDEHRLLLLEFASGSRPVGTSNELLALRDDLHQLEALMGGRQRKQEEFLRAVAGAPPHNTNGNAPKTSLGETP